MKVGVLAVQGNFREHAAMLRALGADVVEVRLPEQLDGLDGLVIPGGESTAIMRLMRLYGLEDAIRGFRAPVLGTCAGMILLAEEVLDGRPDQRSFGAIDLAVRRNAYGRQLDSFIGEVSAPALGDPMPALFIRAPRIRRVGPGVEILGRHAGEPVLVRQDNVVAATFHPELTTDRRLHRMLFSELNVRRSA